MEVLSEIPAYRPNRTLVLLGALLTVIGFFAHFFAAHAMGGSDIAYEHHIFGFFLILVVTGAIILVLARFFWRGRHDITMLVIGVVQALLGILVYVKGPPA